MNFEQIKNQLASTIDLGSWGKGSAKTFQDFCQELKSGESVLKKTDIEYEGKIYANAWLRYVKGVGITLWREPETEGRNWLMLQETVQVFNDGREKHRAIGMSIGEKCLANEDPKEAISRAFQEELGFSPHIVLDKPLHQLTTMQSHSYPGTWRTYDTLVWNCILPQKYCCSFYKEQQSSKTNYWHWRQLPVGVSPPTMNAYIKP